ncbi:DUF378 domain-containing protein [Patescibacteria group bacterium]|nr:DUF378 domain-containing protein [Patescibacteria group bacterium]
MVSKIMNLLLIIGGINWGLVGLGWLMGGADWNVVHMIFGSMMKIEAIVYLLVGIAGVMKLFGCHCKKCMAACASCTCNAESNAGGNMGGNM